MKKFLSKALLLSLPLSWLFFMGDSGEAKSTMTDEDLINPKNLVIGRKIPLLDSFDGVQIGKVFVSKQALLGAPEKGVIGARCFMFCPMGTTEIDATYVFLIEKKKECTLAARAIGWAEKETEYRSGRMVTTAKVRYTGRPVNINGIKVNGTVESTLNKDTLSGPHGTNYKYFPRNSNFLGDQTTDTSVNLDAGFITDLHYFSADSLIAALKKGANSIRIEFPGWQPSPHIIKGREFNELRSLASECIPEDGTSIEEDQEISDNSNRR